MKKKTFNSTSTTISLPYLLGSSCCSTFHFLWIVGALFLDPTATLSPSKNNNVRILSNNLIIKDTPSLTLGTQLILNKTQPIDFDNSRVFAAVQLASSSSAPIINILTEDELFNHLPNRSTRNRPIEVASVEGGADNLNVESGSTEGPFAKRGRLLGLTLEDGSIVAGVGRYQDKMNSTGWNHLAINLPPSPLIPDPLKSFIGGVLEGYLTHYRIRDFYRNTRGLIRAMKGGEKALPKVRDIYRKSLWKVRSFSPMGDHNNPLMSPEPVDPVQKHARLITFQIYGIAAGYDLALSSHHPHPSHLLYDRDIMEYSGENIWTTDVVSDDSDLDTDIEEMGRGKDGLEGDKGGGRDGGMGDREVDWPRLDVVDVILLSADGDYPDLKDAVERHLDVDEGDGDVGGGHRDGGRGVEPDRVDEKEREDREYRDELKKDDSWMVEKIEGSHKILGGNSPPVKDEMKGEKIEEDRGVGGDISTLKGDEVKELKKGNERRKVDVLHTRESTAKPNSKKDEDIRTSRAHFSRCSALVRLTANSSDLFVGHTTWEPFSEMTRIVKYYTFPFQGVKSSVLAFPSYPGAVTSTDDFILTSAGLALTETTIDIRNRKLFRKYSHILLEDGALPDFMKPLIASRLSASGREWTGKMLRMDSPFLGISSCQWMIVDYNKFTKNQKPAEKGGLLYVLETIPGLGHAKDMSHHLSLYGYWNSQNRAWFRDVRQILGDDFREGRAREGGDSKTADEFSRMYNPRSRTFSKLSPHVNSEAQMENMMQFSAEPPFSSHHHKAAEGLSIAPRFDLSDHKPTPEGSTDSKIVDSSSIFSLSFVGISGPEHSTNPPFSWTNQEGKDRFDSKKWPHYGMVDKWNFSWQRISKEGLLDISSLDASFNQSTTSPSIPVSRSSPPLSLSQISPNSSPPPSSPSSTPLNSLFVPPTASPPPRTSPLGSPRAVGWLLSPITAMFAQNSIFENQ